MSAISTVQRGQFSNGLVATSGGLAPRSSHPGLRPSQKPTFQPAAREHLPTAEARDNKATNLNHAQLISAAPAGSAPSAKVKSRYDAAPVGRRHLDPHHFTNLTDDAKRQEGRLGRAHVRPPKGALNSGGLHHPVVDPMNVETIQPDSRRVLHRNLDTSVQLAENRLHRIANGKGAVEGDPAKRAAYQAAAKEALALYRNDPMLVEQEKALSYRIASDGYAASAALRQVAIENDVRRRYAGGAGRGEESAGALGRAAPSLQSSTPFALDNSCPRADTNTSVTGGHGIRIAKGHNRDHFPITGRPASQATAEATGRDSEGVRAAAEELRRQQNERHYEHRGLKGGRPFDDEATGGDNYPVPPPVGVSVGVYQKPLMVRPAAGQHGGFSARGEDRDSLALKRARVQASCARKNGESSPSVDRPEYYAPRTESSQPHALHTTASLRERTEARWKREEATREARRTGKARGAAHHNQHTALW